MSVDAPPPKFERALTLFNLPAIAKPNLTLLFQFKKGVCVFKNTREMEDDLNNSLLLLEHAASTSRGLLKNTLLKEKTSKKRNVNLSITLRPEELEYLESHGMDMSEYDNSYTDILDATSLTGTVIRNNPWKKTVDVLYMEFLEVLQSRTAGSTVLDVISELHRCCADALSVLRSLKSKVHVYELDEELWLENERNIWKLVHVLYQNRLHSLVSSNDGKISMCSLYLVGYVISLLSN